MTDANIHHITISDVLRRKSTADPDTLSALREACDVFSGDELARVIDVMGRMPLSRGMLNTWLVMHSDYADESEIRSDEFPPTYSWDGVSDSLTRAINSIHRDNNYDLARTVQHLLFEVCDSVKLELCKGFVDIDDFSPTFMASYDSLTYTDD